MNPLLVMAIAFAFVWVLWQAFGLVFLLLQARAAASAEDSSAN